MNHPRYAEPRTVSDAATVVLERNPSPMTLEGTNSWILRAPGSRTSVVVDPGEDDEVHLRELLAAAGDVELILLTHEHGDHVGGAQWFAHNASAPVRAFDPSLCRDAGPLVDGEHFDGAGLRIGVRHTPGHTADSVCFEFEHATQPHVLTGDTILGYGTTILADLGDYLRSLRVLAEMPDGAVGLPGHGPELPQLRETVAEYLSHREQRLDQIRQALAALGTDATARQIVEHVYADVDRKLWAAAEVSVRAQLDYLHTAE